MRRCPRCGETVEEDTLHFCDPPTPEVMIKIDVLKVLKKIKEWKERKWRT